MESLNPLPLPRNPRALLLGDAAAYEAAADLDSVRRIGALAWLLTAVLAAALVAIWPPTEEFGAVGWLAVAGLPALVAAAVLSLRSEAIGLIASMYISSLSILLLGLLEWLGGPQAHFTILIAVPMLFVGASQTPRRVVVGVLVSAVAQLVGLLDHAVTLGAATSSVITQIIWIVLAGLALIWTAGVRWQRIALRHEQRHAHHLALHDPVTGLGNRRKLLADLEAAVDSGDHIVLALFDLNGFKAYNDSFGHPAGDALLARLGDKLAQRVDGTATAYRMGGDEFCLLVTDSAADHVRLLASGREALSEHGAGFLITAAAGAATVPEEAGDPVGVLRLADRRMYADKAQRRGQAAYDGAEMLLAVLQERDTSLAQHAEAVAALSERVADHLSLAEPDRRHLTRAAQLHDIGMLAIPDAILNGPLALTDNQGFMERNPIIGQRILGISADLAPVGRIIRSTREHMDGNGYPDRLRGDEIPLAARIIAACAAFDSLTSPRGDHAPLREAEAIAEVRRRSGSEFDPVVVEALAETLRQDLAAAQPARAAAVV